MKFAFLGLLLVSCFASAQEVTNAVPLHFEKDLIPEGIAVDLQNQKLFINSLRYDKIVRCNLDGSHPEDFIKSGEHGYLSGFGMTIMGDVLYALGNSLPKPKNESILLLLHIETGELINSYKLEEAGFAYLNDLAVSSKGNLYITDSESNKIYTVNPKKGELEVFYAHDELKHCNGIAISNDDKYLYFASYTSGLRVLDIASKTLVNQPNNFKGIDGLKFHQNSLVAIVNTKRDATQNGVYQFQLNQKLMEITGEEKIWNLRNESDIPTTFAINNGCMYFVADSQLDNLDQENIVIFDESKLENYTLVKVPLPKGKH
ncbi:SMP-30/gluconolactonase/LRE family protein [Flagellimonas myxillae]|uniref:SMP-30/gluconolactonase/LRE family protein n=1 Tax=Flagellimonas myxillae TaxID=2942214 RepID=UPI00201FAD9E|nr:SMP-30/gluconolactonase/LRE family protein [Muricauda myxillae]MCL6266807.1 SMP-30/gluconolactonase/LRE family protein [Muricauda myxillae]